MGNIQKFLKKKEPVTPAPHLPNYIPFHKVTHRAIGDIPGCVPAPREHTFRSCTIEEARAETGARADAYAAELMKYVNGEYGGKEGLVEMWGAVARLKPLFGPHGEKL